MVVAPLANAGWLFGSIAMAVSLKRAGRVPGAIAIGLPLSWVATLPLAVVGGGVVAGVYWMATGYLLINDGFAPATSSIASPASA